MRSFRSWAWLAGLGLTASLGLWSAEGAAQPPQFQPADAPPGAPPARTAAEDITAPYAVGPQAGPWMICAASYAGENAPVLARQLTEVIRSQHRMPAYIFNHANAERRRMAEDYERACRAAAAQGIPAPRRRVYRIEEQCAVLVGGPNGGWTDPDDANAYLKKVRAWDLPPLRLDSGLSPYDMKLVVAPIPGNQKEGKAVPDGKPINPFHSSIVTRNPTVPRTPTQKPKFDNFWIKLNADEEYSLLKCPKPWTLAVKEYIGTTVVAPHTESSSFLDKIGLGGHHMGEGLTVSELQAHQLAKFLSDPKLGFKAYVLHTRQSSVVTIGEFDGPEDPEMGRTQQRLARLSFQADPRSPNAGRFSKSNLELFARPAPMEVPRP